MLREIIDQWAVECPERIAHQYREQALTYAQLKKYSDTLAVWILTNLEQEREAHSPIVVYGHKESEMLISFIACIKAGHPYVPVDTSMPLERVRQIIAASGTKLILAVQDVPEEIREQGLRIKKISRQDLDADEHNPIPPLDCQVKEEEVYYIIYTSGSTGTPKGVQITLGALESYLKWVKTSYKPIPKQEVFLNQAPFSFDLSVMDLYMSLSTGGTLWSIDKAQIANLREAFASFARSGTTFWVSTPSFAEICLMDKSFNAALLPKLKHFLFCGEVLLHDTATKLLERFPESKVENLYGPTEATVAVTTMTITPEILAEYNPLPVGKAKSDAQVLICDSDILTQAIEQAPQGILTAAPQSLAPGERGEIVIAGPNVSIGYQNNPKQTQKAFFSWKDEAGKLWRAYRTGDAGVFKGDYLFFFGRLDFQVKLHGYRIELGDIEENLRKVPGVENAVVLPVEKKGKVDHLQAFVLPTETVVDEFKSMQAIKEALRQNLPDYMIPRRFTFVSVMPMTPNGKVDRRALQGGIR